MDARQDAQTLIETTTEWLTDVGLEGRDVTEIVRSLGHRLRQSQLQVDRVGCAIVSLHPQIMSEEITWDIDRDEVQTTLYSLAMMESSENRGGPYFQLALKGVTYGRFPIRGSDARADSALLRRLDREGYTDYFGFFHRTGTSSEISPLSRGIGLVPCVVGSFATRQPSGFNDIELECLKTVSKTFALAVRARANHRMAARLLDVYLGHSCGSRVLSGQIVRGQLDRIRCGIWYCDMRGSSRFLTALSPEDYIDLLNRYFDITAGAVMGAGGQVLKFIGDAVLGIFQSDTPGEDISMRQQALAAVTATLSTVSSLSVRGFRPSVGIALHVGEVMFGNVGAENRLDFTIIGRAVNEAARLQDLTKKLKHPVLASAAFVSPIRDQFDFGGEYEVAGFANKLEAYLLRC